MFIRRSATNNRSTGESYFTFRLVQTERVGKSVRQITLLNLGRHFDAAQDDWPKLCARIDEILSAQTALASIQLPVKLERLAQRYAAQLVSRRGTLKSAETASREGSFQEIDTDSLEQVRPRSVGVEHVGLNAIAQTGLADKLTELGVSGKLKNAALANIIGRMAHPGSEQATFRWLINESALGELLDVDFEAMSSMALYRASDELIKHRVAIETHLFQAVQDLFSFSSTVTLYDLTNTFFEGAALGNPKAARGRSKEKRSDSPLVTLGLVLDASGFIQRSQMFAGNVAEVKTLETMLTGLNVPQGALVVMDAGIASQANIDWLADRGYRYLVVSRKHARQFDETAAIEVASKTSGTIKIERVESEDGAEVELRCHSSGREQKERAIAKRLCERLEQGLQKIADGISKPRGEKRLDKLNERIGRLKAKSRVGRHYEITLRPDDNGKTAVALTWTRQPQDGSMLSDPGVYCLRTNEKTWDAEQLWQTYSMLTDLEAVFRSLKSELGLRPIYHHKEARVDGHLFISVLAYQLVQLLRRQLKAQGIHVSWTSLREVLQVQRRVTASFRQRDGHTLNVRKSTLAEPELKAIYDALAIDSAPGGIKKLIS